MAALKVFKQVGKVADSDFLATEVLPILWSFSLGPLLDLQQFQSFMALIKALSTRIEREQTRKLQELSSTGAGTSLGGAKLPAGRSTGATNGISNGEEVDFETLVSGRAANGTPDILNDWGTPAARPTNNVVAPTQQVSKAPTFSWQAPASSQPQSTASSLRAQPNASRSVTPDLNSFGSLTPSSPFTQPLQPNRSTSFTSPLNPGSQPATINWAASTNNQPSALSNNGTGLSSPPPLNGSQAGAGSFAIPPPPMSQSMQPMRPNTGSAAPATQRQAAQSVTPNQRQGLDKYESLI